MRLLFDEDFNANIIRGLRLRMPSLDGLSIAAAGLSGADDDAVLDHAQQDHRVVVSHDVNTMIGTINRRVGENRPTPPVILVPQTAPIGVAIEELALVVQVAREADFPGGMMFIPI